MIRLLLFCFKSIKSPIVRKEILVFWKQPNLTQFIMYTNQQSYTKHYWHVLGIVHEGNRDKNGVCPKLRTWDIKAILSSFSASILRQSRHFVRNRIVLSRPLRHSLFNSSNHIFLNEKDKKERISLIFTNFSRPNPVYCVNAKNL